MKPEIELPKHRSRLCKTLLLYSKTIMVVQTANILGNKKSFSSNELVAEQEKPKPHLDSEGRSVSTLLSSPRYQQM